MKSANDNSVLLGALRAVNSQSPAVIANGITAVIADALQRGWE